MTREKAAFQGILNLYQCDLDALKSKHICIIGVGGVGSWASEMLVRSGIGEITLIDLDEVCLTNINRQVQAHFESVGQSKISLLEKRLKLINPHLKVHLIHDFLTSKNMENYISSRFDFVLDAIDSANIKTNLILYCKRNKIPLIVTGAAGGKTDPSLVTYSDLNHTVYDKLLFRIRKSLRREHGFSRDKNKKYRIPVVYSPEPPRGDQKASGISCDTGMGSAGFITATFGNLASGYIINKLIEK
jgi:tRNA A37 threonylcarbamoyladenosine dehydratase